MAEVQVVGIQKVAAGPVEPPIGSLVSGLAGGKSVLAFAAHDHGGRFYVSLEDQGRMSVLSDTEIVGIMVIEGALIIEPSDDQVPFALPIADSSATHGLVVNADGEVGLQLKIQVEGKPYTVQTNLMTGGLLGGSPRRILSGFQLSLKVEDREKPLIIGNF